MSNETQMRDDIARELFVFSVQRNDIPLELEPVKVAEVCFNLANAFMEARERNTKRLVDKMTNRRNFIGAGNE